MGNAILVVDDSATIRAIARESLEEHGFTVIEAENGAVGLSILQSAVTVDLVLADQNMPVMTGMEMIKELRKIEKHGGTPVIMLTTESGEDMAAEAKKNGVVAWITKPFKPEMLAAALKKVLSRSI